MDDLATDSQKEFHGGINDKKAVECKYCPLLFLTWYLLMKMKFILLS